MSRFASRHAAFTLLEIMLVVLIIGLLIGLAIRYQAPFLDKGRSVAVEGHIQGYKSYLLLFNSDNGFYPTTEQGLKALTTKPEAGPKLKFWREYMEKQTLDPWQQEYHYECPGKHNPKSYDIYSAGPDRMPGTADDIGNWDNPTN